MNSSTLRRLDRSSASAPNKPRAIIKYIEEHLNADLTLEQMAAAHLSACHFARQFKAATGMPLRQYVIARRFERAKQLLQPDRDLPPAEVAARVGESNA